MHLSEPDILDHLLYQLPDTKTKQPGRDLEPASYSEETSLLQNDRNVPRHGAIIPSLDGAVESVEQEEDPTSPFVGRNALEIAAIADAKKFLSQRTVQNLVNAIWSGDVIFWESLSLKTERKAQKYNKRYVTALASPLTV